jgi:hypothetical protein
LTPIASFIAGSLSRAGERVDHRFLLGADGQDMLEETLDGGFAGRGHQRVERLDESPGGLVKARGLAGVDVALRAAAPFVA